MHLLISSLTYRQFSNMFYLHIHVNYPFLVMWLISGFTPLRSEKMFDMTLIFLIY